MDQCSWWPQIAKPMKIKVWQMAIVQRVMGGRRSTAFSLQVAVLFMVGCGFVMFFNSIPKETDRYLTWNRGRVLVCGASYGWPLTFYAVYLPVEIRTGYVIQPAAYFSFINGALDLLVGVALVCACLFFWKRLRGLRVGVQRPLPSDQPSPPPVPNDR